MVSTAEIRDLWEAEQLEDANRRNEPEPEPWAELAYMRWHMARSAVPAIEVDPERTWVWSDLHLDDDSVVITEQRPYGSTTAMNRALLAAWRATVKVQDTIICLGDIAHPDSWNDPHHPGDLRACPGRRILVMGNHDVRQTEEPDRAGFTQRHWALMLDTDPPAALTHAPLKRRPIPAVNIHGHLHGAEDVSSRHANVSVERTAYRPLRLSDVLAREGPALSARDRSTRRALGTDSRCGGSRASPARRSPNIRATVYIRPSPDRLNGGNR